MIRVELIAVLFAGICSVQSFPLLPPIVGGVPVNISEYPYQISMRCDGRHLCGGTIFSQNTIISAAHCVVHQDIMKLTIVAGITYRSEQGVELPVVEIIMHPKYKPSTMDYDVAVLVLDGHFRYNDRIQRIALAKQRPEDNATVTVTGWGNIEADGYLLPDQLQKVDVNVVSNRKCMEAYDGNITDRMLCAGATEGGKDSCQGDSGGPLTFNNELLGIVSWGYGCGLKSHPGVYASVPDLYDWIEQTCEKNAIQFI